MDIVQDVIFSIVQHEEVDPVTGTKHVQLHKFDVVKILLDSGFEEVMNTEPLHERAAERLRRRLYETMAPT